MKCGICKYWVMGIPIGKCLHPETMFMVTDDRMVFEDASDKCPLDLQQNYSVSTDGE